MSEVNCRKSNQNVAGNQGQEDVFCHECGEPNNITLPIAKCLRYPTCGHQFCYKCIRKYEIDSFIKADFKHLIENPKLCPVCKKIWKCDNCNFQEEEKETSPGNGTGRKLRNRDARKTEKGQQFYESLRRKNERKQMNQSTKTMKSTTRSKTSTSPKRALNDKTTGMAYLRSHQPIFNVYTMIMLRSIKYLQKDKFVPK